MGLPPFPERVTIPPPDIPPDQSTVQFSFKHLDFTNRKFQPTECSQAFWCALMSRLKVYSALTVEIFQDHRNPDRRHIIDFRETTEPNGFTSVDTEQLAWEEPWQFDLITTEPWRVAGLLVQNVFYIIWFDPEHRLYP
jgi:hypothetical protein